MHHSKVFYAWDVRGGFSHILYALSAEAHFNVIHYLFTWMSCKQTTFSLMFMKMLRGKRLRSQTNEVVVNVYDYCEELNRCKWTHGSLKKTADATRVSHTRIKRLQIVLMTNSSRHSQSSFFVKRFFSEPQWLCSCLKWQKTILDYYFNNNNDYDGTSVHIIRTLLLNCHVIHSRLVFIKSSKVCSFKYGEGMPLTMYGVF